ncbi:MAG TPA: response regulator [Granulicella sp.]
MTGEELDRVPAQKKEDITSPVRVLLLDNEPVNLVLRSTILRRHGYECFTVSTMEEATQFFHRIDIAVLDYHLGAGRFGSEVALELRRQRPEVPIIILSSTLDHYFGGAEDLHLLKGYSSNENLIAAIRSLDAKRRGTPVVADARRFFCSRIFHALGSDLLIQIFDHKGLWVDCNEAAAEFLSHERDWFPGRHPVHEMPAILRNWHEIVLEVLTRGESYIDRTRQGLLDFGDTLSETPAWSIMAAPIRLYDGQPGVVLIARALSAPIL